MVRFGNNKNGDWRKLTEISSIHPVTESRRVKTLNWMAVHRLALVHPFNIIEILYSKLSIY